jgi:5-methylcytosine-specific restriction endonuclease McrA
VKFPLIRILLKKSPERPLCEIEGCNNLAMMLGLNKGIRQYAKLCTSHHRKKYKMKNGHDRRYILYLNGLGEWTKKPCQRCGWNESYCDLHRIVEGKDGGKYTMDNVLILCPNCHRIEHRGILKKIAGETPALGDIN